MRSRRFIRRSYVVAATALLVVFASGFAWCAPADPQPPGAVMDAITASSEPNKPAEVVVGAYINDIQELDFKANNYVVDLYVWFRWKSPDIDPAKTMEFMNRFASDDNVREALYDQPKEMPDGSRYSIVRYQGRFAAKFPLEKYPFDTQFLKVAMEDTGAGSQIYVPDGEHPVTLDQ